MGKRASGRGASGQRAARRPSLTPETSPDDFQNYYWYAAELAAFCRRYDLDASGHKLELVRRVAAFLATGRRPRRRSQTPRRVGRLVARRGPITTRTRVTDQYRCDAETRAFFKTVIGDHFHFTAHLQRYRRQKQAEGVPLTYGDLVREWLAEHERRKNPAYRSPIAQTWQYNQFVRDFMADRARNDGKRLSDAARAWNAIRRHRGPHTYAEYARLEDATGAGA